MTWEAEGAADTQNIHFLHGALHLYDDGPDLQKKCWERSGGVPLVDQIRAALAQDKFPLFVSEGDTDAKLVRIRHSGYLQRSLKASPGYAEVPGPAFSFRNGTFLDYHSVSFSVTRWLPTTSMCCG